MKWEIKSEGSFLRVYYVIDYYTWHHMVSSWMPVRWSPALWPLCQQTEQRLGTECHPHLPGWSAHTPCRGHTASASAVSFTSHTSKWHRKFTELMNIQLVHSFKQFVSWLLFYTNKARPSLNILVPSTWDVYWHLSHIVLTWINTILAIA